MQFNRQRNVSLGVGTLALIGVVWVGVTVYRSSNVRADASFLPCEGGGGRFNMVVDGSTHYLLDTCSGDVWTLVHSPIKGDPGAWAVMDRYDTREEVARLLEFIRSAPHRQSPDAGGAQAGSTDAAGGTAAPTPGYQDPAADQPAEEPTDVYPPQERPVYEDDNAAWE